MYYYLMFIDKLCLLYCRVITKISCEHIYIYIQYTYVVYTTYIFNIIGPNKINFNLKHVYKNH